MIENNFDALVDAIGKPESEVVSLLGLRPGNKAESDADSFYYVYYPEAGVELAFETETSRFMKVHIIVSGSSDKDGPYQGSLPLGISRGWNREQVIMALGDPIKTWPPVVLPVIGERGGCDSFPMHVHPELELFIGYSIAGEIDQVSVMHKNRIA